MSYRGQLCSHLLAMYEPVDVRESAPRIIPEDSPLPYDTAMIDVPMDTGIGASAHEGPQAICARMLSGASIFPRQMIDTGESCDVALLSCTSPSRMLMHGSTVLHVQGGLGFRKLRGSRKLDWTRGARLPTNGLGNVVHCAHLLKFAIAESMPLASWFSNKQG
jgi:hypothetical protein